MKKTIITLLILALAVPAALMADPGNCGPRGHGGQGGPGICDGSGPGGPGRGDGPRGMRGMGFLAMADELGLTEQQLDQIETLRSEFQLKQIDRQAELRKAELKLRDLRFDADASQTSVLAAIDEVGQLRNEMEKARYVHHKAVLDVLTTEQQDKAKELRRQRWSDDDRPGAGRRGGHGSKAGKGGRGQGRGF